MEQCTNNILMIKPVGFRYNEQTATNNYYQHVLDNVSPTQVQESALHEFNELVDVLINAGVHVVVFKDTETLDTPDSIFPNNWVSFHADGRIGLYPMFAENRRGERRSDIIESFVAGHVFAAATIVDYTHLEKKNIFLEGTGSMVLDRVNKICYASISQRTNKIALDQFCQDFKYTLVCFTANQTVEGERLSMYHTNVMMCIGNSFAVICLETIDNAVERECVVESLQATNKEIIEITEEQTARFAGNMLQVMGVEPCVVMSTSAFQSLDNSQIAEIEKHGTILHTPLDTIEACGGGSARCMMAEVFLEKPH
jgi:hypothetical protein